VSRARGGPRRIVVSVCLLLAWAFGASACSSVNPPGSAAAPTSSAEPSNSSLPTPSTSLSAPKASVAQDGEFLTDVTEADPALATYEQKHGNVALRALLTDGSAFCAFLQGGGGIDNAMVSVVVGARSDESQTHLPLSVTTFNSVDAVALLTLCPSDQKLVPASDRSKIRQLGDTLADRSG
jgi:hypothetical protein